MSLAATLALASPALSQGYLCGGVEPSWSLEIKDETALFSTPDQNGMSFEIPLTTQTQGRDWPIALTLISQSATGIALIRERSCSDTMSDTDFPFEIDYLTQSGSTPVIYTGCCRLPPKAQ